MDITLLLAFCSVIALIILAIILFIKTAASNPKVQEQIRRPNVRAENVPRRAQVVRNQRARLRANAAARHEEPDENEDLPEDQFEGSDEKIGAKKRAKMEAKAEKKAQRETEERLREDRKKREQVAEEERQKQREKEEAEEKRKEEEEQKAREEQERREHEEYLKLKEAFAVEEEGFEDGEEENENSLLDFINYIKKNKVNVIEDLAAHFKLKTQAAIDRIQDLQKDNLLSGVIDDRGKFIYISQEELEAVTKFIKQRGRVSIAELADSSNSLINMNPNKPIVT